MNYINGGPAFVGDVIEIWDGMRGIVVCDFDGGKFIRGYKESDWSVKMSGIMVLSDSGDLFHFEEGDEDMTLLERGQQ